MNDTDRLVFSGALVNSALYFVAVLAAAIYLHKSGAIYVDVAAIGVTYLSYVAQALGKFGGPVVALSILVGAAAGILLLF